MRIVSRALSGALSLALSMMLSLALVACGSTASGGAPSATTASGGDSTVPCPATQTIQVDADSFPDYCDKVKVNVPVVFNDPASTGVLHYICVGEQSTCDKVVNPDVPKDLLAPGFTIKPGEQHTETFTKPGTYMITCPLHPMTVKLIVS